MPPVMLMTQQRIGWFKNKRLKATPEKSHILLRSKIPEIVPVDGISIAASSQKKLPGVIIDSELMFENHITEPCLKVSKKITLSVVYQVSCH